MLSIKGLTHVYPNGTRALDGVDLEIDNGMFGLLGPNGAGKSTLMRAIATLQTPTAGAIRFGDIDVIAEPEKLRRTLGYLPQDFGVYPRVSAVDLLDHMAVLKGIASKGERKDTVETLLQQVNLWDVRKKAVAGYSGGMRQRFGIAQALIGRPSLIIVDEPTAGLDPEERNRFLNLLAEIGENVVVILSTHIVEDVSDLCPRMAILGLGRILKEGVPEELTRSLDGKLWKKTIARADLEAERSRHEVIASRLATDRLVIHVLADSRPDPAFEPITGGLDDVYFSTLFGLAPRGLTGMFGKIAAFELRYQLRQPIFWIASLIFFALVFGAVGVDNVHIGSGGNVHKNSPKGMGEIVMVMTIFFMFVSTAFVANVIVRDEETGFGPIVRSTRITKFDYLFGRFLGAFVAVAISFLAVPLAIWIGSLMPWVDPETMGPNVLGDYVFAYLWLALPGLFLTSALFFTLTTLTRSMMGAYIGVAGLLVAYLLMNVALQDPEKLQLAALVDPFAYNAWDLATRYYTAAEANAHMPPLVGPVMWNHAIWMPVAFAVLAVAWFTYNFEEKAGRARRPKVETQAPPPMRPLALPRDRGLELAWARLTKRTRFEMGQVFKSPAFVVLLAMGLFNALGGLALGAELQGSALYPVTRWVIGTLDGSFTFLVVLVAVFYAGELVWRERDRRTHEIVDATAVPNWAFLVPKTIAIALVLLTMLLTSAAMGIIVQLIDGYFTIQPGKYLFWYILPNAIDWTLIAVLAVFCQAVSPHKFVGWGLMVLFLVARLVFPTLGFEHNLYLFGARTAVPLSDMNGQGDFAGFAAWYRAYWTAFALILLVVAYGLWPRGTETRLMPRLRRLPRRLAGPAGIVGGAALGVFICLGGTIFYHTNIENEYRTTIGDEKWLAAYEKAFLKNEKLVQPSVTDVELDLDLHPHTPKLTTEGVYHLLNDTAQPIRELHVRLARDTKALQMSVNGASKVRAFDRFNYRIFTFDHPLMPGERTVLSFQTVMFQDGFKNSGNMTRIVDNGTFVDNFDFGPVIGMDRSQLLKDRAKRRKYGLPPQLRPPKLEDRSAQARNYLANADWVNADIAVTTDADQTPVAPGYRISDVTKGGRRTIRFRTDAPVLNTFSVQSARYAIRREVYKGVELAVYYDAQHPWNVERMIKGMKTGLDYYQANFSAYQYHQARILEFPDYAQFAQAFANTMPYSEGIGFITDNTKPDKIDYPTYVTAHELAHQWWGYQLIGADMQGDTALSETLAQYSALIVMEKTYGQIGIRKFLKYELDRYLRSRGGEAVEELPLIRVENQPYIHYRKGSLVMYLLRDRMGEAKVNAALRTLLQKYAFKGAPYPRSQDLVDALRAQAGNDPVTQQLITDLFEKITLYDLSTQRALVSKRPDGRYDVTMTIGAKKAYADGKGKETDAPIPASEAFDLGVFTAEPGKPKFTAKDVLYFQRIHLRSGVQTVKVTVDKEPAWAGVDPYNKQIDRNTDDNAIKTLAR